VRKKRGLKAPKFYGFAISLAVAQAVPNINNKPILIWTGSQIKNEVIKYNVAKKKQIVQIITWNNFILISFLRKGGY
tara:strand:+ start:404 stop:634 length:231 start_codon:yes stop_codon:yes gene_type:complete